MSTTPRIYVASLSDYNAGRLHGEWIDASQDADDIHEAIRAMLKKSKESVAEEWAIHDFEGFEGIELKEYSNIEWVSVLAELVEQHGKAFAVWFNNDSSIMQTCDASISDLEDKFQEAYRGEFESLADYAQQFNEEIGTEIPEYLANYIDWESMGRDMQLGGDIFTVDNGYNSIFVFSNN